MERASAARLRIGEWIVDPTSGQISRNGETARLEGRTMRLLLYLAERAGEVVGIDDLLKHVWSGVIVTQDSVYQSVASLRRLLGDDPKRPTYIATVPRLGYRLVAPVAPVAPVADPLSGSTNAAGAAGPAVAALPADVGATAPATVATTESRGWRRWPAAPVAWATVAVVGLTLAATLLSTRDSADGDRRTADAATAATPRPDRSIAVLPFLDLTEEMTEEPFADGMTEELIGRLSRVPGLRVPAPTSSFYFKGKRVTIGEVARSLGVAYVLDGSVRKSGDRLRVAARLVRADNGFVVWTESYDRPFDDLLMVQDDIAGAVTKALQASIEASP